MFGYNICSDFFILNGGLKPQTCCIHLWNYDMIDITKWSTVQGDHGNEKHEEDSPNVIQTPKRIQVAGDSVTIKKILTSTETSGIHGTNGVWKWSSTLFRGWRTSTIQRPRTQTTQQTVIVTTHHSPARSRLQAFTINKHAAVQIITRISRVTITMRLVRAVGLQFHQKIQTTENL